MERLLSDTILEDTKLIKIYRRYSIICNFVLIVLIGLVVWKFINTAPIYICYHEAASMGYDLEIVRPGKHGCVTEINGEEILLKDIQQSYES